MPLKNDPYSHGSMKMTKKRCIMYARPVDGDVTVKKHYTPAH